MEKEQVESALASLSSLVKDIARMEEVEATFAEKIAALEKQAEDLRAIQNRIESSFSSIQIALDSIAAAVDSAKSLTNVLSKATAKLTEMDPQGLRGSLDSVSSSINKGLDRILKAEREKTVTDNSIKGLVKGGRKRK